ncbi:S41 family peptidase [Streptacidiphilus jiangxiensis]|uniref:Tricorn protease homolog n=1 Tax=Streptacidiphilus jiangxiensis TaxID=235985 RepID=A0A1H7SA07_STRJI|nr:S41 family peptidase [Streptacidiphilus jiangxiensis]SEL69375.1 tricorn protease [Streptacidiphilus jiangxiensis]
MTQTQTQQTGPAEGYFRYPHLHGDLVAFVAEDDVWVAPLDGGRAWRVSADHVPVAGPRFSPDGTLLAWASTRDGAPEVHVAPVDGGPARRLTYWGNAQTAVLGWTADGEVLVASSQGRRSRAHVWAHAVPLDGGPARTLPFGRLGKLALQPDGAGVLLSSATNGREAAHWKRYRGGLAGKLWIGTEGGEFTRLHAELDGQLDSPMWVGDRVAFLSDHDGVARLWSSRPDGSDLRAHGGHDFYARNAATDGARVVYHAGGELWLVEDLAERTEPRRLEIRLGGPRSDRQPFPVDAARNLGSVAVDGDGRSSVVEVRGTLHRVTHRDGPVRALATTPGVRHRLPVALPDGDSAWVTDAEGEDAIEFSDGRRLLAGRLGRVEELAASPDGTLLAAADRTGRVLLIATATDTPAEEALRELDRSEHGLTSGLTFSPDSRWLAWSHPRFAEAMLSQIRLARVETGEIVEATASRFRDWSPTFTGDGRHLAFLSARDFDPVYDEHAFDLAFPVASRPYLLTLTAEALSPFGPLPQGRPVGKNGDGDGKADAGTDEPPATEVDTEGLDARVLAFPVPAGRYDDLAAVKGGVAWMRHPVAGVLGNSRATTESEAERSSLEYYDLSARRLTVLVDQLDGYAVSGDGSRLVVRDRGALTVLPADSRVDKDDRDARFPVDLSRVRVTVDPTAEWRQMFDETARLMRDNFWRADLGGLDWDAVQAQYRPLVERVGSHGDLVDVLWELQGAPGTSHAYVTPPAAGPGAERRQGFLGADLARDEQGVWRVAAVLPGESSDPHARSPLAAPGVAVRAGDALVAVSGRPVDALTGPAPLLVGTAGKPVELTVLPAGGDAERTVVVVPLADEAQLRYHAWVTDRRAHVREASGGRLGYLHVPDMVSHGWAQLHRDLRSEVARDGLVVDVRENRGGHTSQLVIEKLNRRVIGWDVERDCTPTTYPFDAPRGPLVAVTDEFAGSDGDIVGAAFQALRLGPVVGVRSWGGVIGIDGRYSLVDGTGVTQPRYATWMEGYGWGLENHGVDPDVEVVCAPQDWVAGRDPQLDEAISLALAALESRPAATPPSIPEL